MPSFFNLKGYTGKDPLDKAMGLIKYMILIAVNLLLNIALLWLVTKYKIVIFNGFTIFHHNFSNKATLLANVILNCLVFSPLIILSRKCSSIIPYLLVLIPYLLLDLYIESHYRSVAGPILPLWDYYNHSFLTPIKPPVLKFFVSLSADAVLFGIIGLYLARLLASLIYQKKAYPTFVTEQQFYGLFKKEWCEENVAKPKRDAEFYILRLLGIGYLLYLLILFVGLLGASPWPGGVCTLITMTYKNPVLAINTFFKITLMIILAFTSAYNKSLRFHCCIGLLTGHFISTAYSFVFHFYKPLHATDTDFLFVSGLLDGAMVLIFLWLLFTYKKDGEVFAPEHDNPIDYSLPNTLLRSLYKAMCLLFSLMVVLVICVRIFSKCDTGISAVFGSPDPMLGNTITLYATLAVLSFLLVSREQLRVYLFNPILIPLCFGSILSLLWIIIGGVTNGASILNKENIPVHVDWFFVLNGVVGLLVSLLMVAFRRMYYEVDYGINTINPSAAIDAIALTNAFYKGTDKLHSQILQSIDRYVGGISGRKRGLLNIPFALFENVLNFVYGLRPAFSAMEINEQRYYLKKYFFRDKMQRKKAFIPPLADLSYSIGLSLNSIITFAQYNQINTKYGIGYVPVDARDRTQGNCAAYNPPFKKIADLPLNDKDPNNFKPASECMDGPMIAPRVTTPVLENDVPAEVDYVVIGSGAGGATMAYRLACSVADPSRILVVESGTRFQPLQDFADNEMEMMKKLYKEGGLQQTKNFTMTLVQASCVGGTTVINNAVCFKMPDHIRELWQNNYGIDTNLLDNEYDTVQQELSIKSLGEKGINQTSKAKFENAVTNLNSTLPIEEKLNPEYNLLVNHLNNTGDGNWNIGNKRMQKRSMLETYIPWSEAKGVKVVPNMSAIKFISNDQRKATHVVLRAGNGKMTAVAVRKAVIVSAGALASSHFLMRSNTGNPNVGKKLSCNFAFPITLDFEDEIKAFDGDQITLAALDPQFRSAFETYFNPPASFAITSVPFFFDRRDSVMNRYRYLLNFGSLIGSEPNGVIEPKADLLNGQAFTWTLGNEDIAHIKYAFAMLVKLGYHAGAKRVILPTKPGIELDLSDPDIIDQFTNALNGYPLDITDLYIGTAHPQGGNLMAGNNTKHAGERVVNEDFLLDGYDNVFVADASVFPTSITVNPQWTIMAMSSLAAKSVLKRCP